MIALIVCFFVLCVSLSYNYVFIWCSELEHSMMLISSIYDAVVS